MQTKFSQVLGSITDSLVSVTASVDRIKAATGADTPTIGTRETRTAPTSGYRVTPSAPVAVAGGSGLLIIGAVIAWMLWGK